MMKLIRILLTSLLLAVLLFGLTWTTAGYDLDGSPGFTLSKRSDQPWDPGDESERLGVPSHLDVSHCYIAKKGEKPWDPGEESADLWEVSHA